MGTPAQNVAILKDAYRQWDETKGKSVQAWLDLMTDDVKVRSLAAGRPGASFTMAANSKPEFRRYFEGLLSDWEMINYKTDTFIAEGDRVVTQLSVEGTQIGAFAGVPASGRLMRTHGTEVYRIRGGKIVEGWSWFGPLEPVAGEGGPSELDEHSPHDPGGGHAATERVAGVPSPRGAGSGSDGPEH